MSEGYIHHLRHDWMYSLHFASQTAEHWIDEAARQTRSVAVQSDEVNNHYRQISSLAVCQHTKCAHFPFLLSAIQPTKSKWSEEVAECGSQ